MKRLVSVLVAPALLLAVGSLRAQEKSDISSWLSGNVTVATDYTFRGISQTLQQPAIQGGIDLKHPSGFYLGTWGSSVNFGEADATVAKPRAQLELDGYGGYTLAIPSVVALDLGAIYYSYPGASLSRDFNYLELGLGASRSIEKLGLGLMAKYSPDFFAGSGTGFYYGGSASVPVAMFTLSGNVGKQMIEDNVTFGTPDYIDWGAGAAVGWHGFTVGGKVVGTDLKDAECFGGSNYCGTRVIGSITRAM
jgi:uncharacterized protein (TIGR02001 family)